MYQIFVRIKQPSTYKEDIYRHILTVYDVVIIIKVCIFERNRLLKCSDWLFVRLAGYFVMTTLRRQLKTNCNNFE